MITYSIACKQYGLRKLILRVEQIVNTLNVIWTN